MNFPEELLDAWTSHGRADYGLVEEIIKRRLHDGGIRAYLQSILSGNQAALLCQRSYLHPNGFEKFVLMPPTDNQVIRLHFWSESNLEQIRTSNFHSHVRSYASAVMHGTLLDLSYAEVDDGEIDAYKYSVDERPLGASYTPLLVGKTRLRKVSEASISRGETYSRDYKVIHRSWPLATPCATLFCQGPATRDMSETYNSEQFDEVRNAGPQPFSEEYFRGALAKALTYL